LPGAVVGSQVMREIAAPTGTTVARIIIRLWSPASWRRARRPIAMTIGNSRPTRSWFNAMLVEKFMFGGIASAGRAGFAACAAAQPA
jgi:hypothetical protein